MANGERPGSGGGGDWRVRLATGVGAIVGAAVALLWRPDLSGLWTGLLAFLAVTAAGAVLGRLVGGLLFRPPGA